MIKKQQKWIALLVTVTFAWLLQVSAMPLAAANAPEQIRAASAEQGPRYIEEEGDGGYQPKKKSILPIVLIGVGVAAVAAVLFLVVLKTKYDIVGTWKVDYTGAPPYNSFNITFSGTKASGTWTLAVYTDTGTYTVDGKNVTFVFNGAPWTFTGTFDGKDKITGTHTWPAASISGTWTATRLNSSSAADPILQSNQGSLVEKVQNQ